MTERKQGVAASPPGHQGFAPQPAAPSSQSGVPNADLSQASDEVLATAAARTRRLVNALSAAELADLGVARYEADTLAAERVLMRNFAQTQAARAALRKIETEIARRAASGIVTATADETPSGGSGERSELEPGPQSGDAQ